ncbi:helix-turn-helix domain-containing protein [Robertmurraya andreesenii]|uniref:Transcriptional regulator with XRE-family HTH domain n=1 Tax=Anoxybacillus andreesenii TaxID=1325932 RepID=A0ABT9V205_9BACL|nr:helix-turn-helix transcriptional regulator [Robertmurraya andreesenii]MDQ0154969.1 transcriptional regulator with XRE-family HTH domain [Robertmurraya andreesenii]
MAVEVTITNCLLRDRRLAADLTQEELARIIGISKSRVSEYENMERIMSFTTLIKFAYVLNCGMDELYKYKIVGRRRG